MTQTKWLLDSGDPDEYKAIAKLAKEHNQELWGSTTNPSLIAKKLARKKVTQKEAFALQKEIVLEILSIVPGAVSAEVYADEKTSSTEMIEQGREIAMWGKRVMVKLPTTVEGFKARTTLRKEKIMINNTLVFSQQQIFAICLHEEIIQKQFGRIADQYPPFISPFVGRLDDRGEDGMQLVEYGMKIKDLFLAKLWMLEASVRSIDHVKRGMALQTELLTAPAKLYTEWFTNSRSEELKDAKTKLNPIPYWHPSQELIKIDTIEMFMHAIESGTLDITHELTDKGIVRFAADWKAIIS